MMTIKTRKIFYAAAALTAMGLLATVVVHAQGNDLGVSNFAEAAGASTTDIRVIVARIIRAIFGVLGVVAVVITLYAGFLWMTSGGDEDKVATARRLLLNAVIGLAIMLSAFAIAQFVISRLLLATGNVADGAGGGGRGGGVGGGLPAGAFYVRSISPSGDVLIRNVVVRALLSDAVDPASVSGNFTVASDGVSVDGAAVANGRVIEFTPSAPCPPPNEDRKCFDADTQFTVAIRVRSARGQPLVCGGLAPSCDGSFKTGSLVDVSAPKNVAITAPDEGQSVPVDSSVEVWARATDDAGIAYIDVAADGSSLPPIPADPPVQDFVGTAEWDTSGVSLGRHTLSARAFDVDSNSAASEPVTVNVRPQHCFNRVQDEPQGESGVDCGGACGACVGAACGDAGGCAGGVCEGGLCVELPRIDAFSLPATSPGVFHTISGAFFGDREGKVIFLGGPESGDDREAKLCAPEAWSDTEITVIVPLGFESGPLRVVRSDDRFDDTNDAHGPLLPDVRRSTPQGAPSICSISPNRVKPGDRITIIGQGMVNPPPAQAIHWLVAGREYYSPQPTEVWEEKRIVTVVPRIALSDTVVGWLDVRANGNGTNRKQVLVLPPETGVRPLVESIAPGAGPPGQYVTLRGSHFGAAAGRVIFARGADRAIGNADFPDECSDRFWSNTSVTVKVPRAYSDGTPVERVAHAASIVRADGVASNDVAFTVNDDPLGPGICLLDPDNGPAGVRVQIFGERFGNVPGAVRFSENQESAVDGPWRDRRVSNARVPVAAVTGPVTVSVGGPSSNGALFAVGACRADDSCVVGQHCCGDGVCRLDCESARPVGAFQYRFSTGDIPRLPTVIEAATCDGVGQSPSPYTNTTDACVNSSVVARFSTLMDAASVRAGGVEWVRCNSGAALDQNGCGEAVPQGREVGVGQWSPPGGGAGGSLLELTPSGALATDTWYRVTLFSSPPDVGLRSVDGVFLDGDRNGSPGGDYVWYFHTREDASSCTVDHVELSPERAVIEEQDGMIRYIAAAVATNCNQMCEGFSWDWSSDFGGARILDPGPDDAVCARSVQGAAETPPGAEATITASVVEPTGRKSDKGELVINFLDPQIVASWPSCTEACVNAEVGARFNTPLDEETINGDTVLVFECTNESCLDFRDPAGVGALPATTHEIRLGRAVAIGFTIAPPGGRWRNGTYYRVVVRGGAAGIQSSSGALLSGVNYGADASWTFKVGDSPELCDIAAADVEPDHGTVQIVGDIVNYRVRARGRADSCDPDGQPLAATDYSWSWSVDPATVASADFSGGKDILPLTISDAAGRLVRSGPQCSAICTNSGTVGGVAVCGNGEVETPFEECERGQPGCSDRCLHTGSAGGAACGDGAVRAELGEDCDFGYRCSVSGRSCEGPSADCGAGQGFCAPNGGRACSNTGAACAADRDCGVGGRCAPTGYRGCSDSCVRLGSLAGSSTCGNRDIGDGEDCDDGNTASGDGCSSQCLAEGSRPAPFPVCGNGSVEPGEDCDFGDRRDGDGCSSRCLHEGSRACVAARDLNCCGDGLVFETAEDCDDGNARSGDGCSSQCLKEGSSARLGFSEATASYCGDSVIDEADPVARGESCEFIGPTDGRLDPDSYIRSLPPNFSPDERRGSRTGTVTAVTRNRSGANVPGTAQFTLSCSCTTDASCEGLVAGGGGPAGVGCGLGSCCYPRPAIIRDSLQPRPPENTCRNTLVGGRFSERMDASSLNANVLLLEHRSYVPDARCPTGQTTFLGADWCIASAQAGVAAQEVGDGTIFTVNLSAALDPTAVYVLLIIGDRNTGDGVVEGVKSANGVAMSGYVLYEFFTGSDICSLDAVQTSWQPVPGNPVQSHWLFTSAANDARDDPAGPLFDTLADKDKVAYAQGYASRAGVRLEALNPIPGVYAWDWSWSPATGTPRRLEPVAPDGPAAAVSVISGAENGSDPVTARATVTRNILGVSCDPADEAGARRICGAARRCEDQGGAIGGRCVGESRFASIVANVLLCENPWPARAADGSWEPYVDDTRPGRRGTQFSFYYCRDAGNQDRRDDDLPAPRLGPGGNAVSLEAIPGAPAALADILFPLDCASPDHDRALCTEGDALGLRVYPNSSHLSPLRWYTAQGFGGRPVAASLDGYDAVRDGRTIYAHAGNKVGDPQLYTNAYVLSYNEGGSAALQRIWNDVQKNFHLNANMVSQNAGICRLAATSTCSSDLDCSGADNVCDAPKDKLRRDVRRFQDLRDIEAALERHYAVNQRCSISGNRCFTNDDCPAAEACVGSYPDLAAGTFLPGRSASTWPSWQATLGNAVGAALPVDPVNRFTACPEGSDSQTCWNAARSEFACPARSHVYQYEKNGLGYTASTDFEFKICDGGDRDGESCALDADCLGGACNLPISSWQGLNDPASHVTRAGNFDNRWALLTCVNQIVGAGAARCGDGVISGAEECEGTESRVEACGGAAGFRRAVCNGPAAPRPCTFDRSAACAASACPNGVREVGEACDAGALAGRYGQCATNCLGLADHCGDGTVQAGLETCDLGGFCAGNPVRRCANDAGCRSGEGDCIGATIYGATRAQSCRFDCRAVGPFCGDLTVQSANGEQCDGNNETRACSQKACSITASRFCALNRDCPSGESCSRETVQQRTCSGGCRFVALPLSPEGWSSCTAVGACGDGRRDAGEQCDDGNRNNNDACTTSCRTNVCGDGYVNPASEGCDDGSRNVRPDDAAEIARRRDACPYGAVCSFCATSCISQSVSGGSCGNDAVERPYEMCEVGADRTNWQKVCVGSNRPCATDRDCGGRVGSCYVYGASSMCAADCQSACPPSYQPTSLSFRERNAAGAYINRFSQSAALENNNPLAFGVHIPECRLNENRTVSMDFAFSRTPPLNVVFIVDTSQGMARNDVLVSRNPDVYTSKLELSKTAMRQAIDGIFDNYGGEVNIGVVTFSSSNHNVLRNPPGAPNWFTPHTDAEDPKYAGTSSCIEGTDPAVCLASSDPDALVTRRNRATLTTVINQLADHNTDYGAMGFFRAGELLQGKVGAKVVIYLSDGESKCGDPAAYPRDDAAPVCYNPDFKYPPGSGETAFKNITEPLATKAADDLKRRTGVEEIKIYTIAVNASREQKAQMLNRSSDCPPSSPPLTWSASPPGRWSADIRTCVAAAVRQYAKEATPTQIASIFQNIVSSITTFKVTVGGQITRDLTVGADRAVQLPATFACRPGATQDLAISIQTFTGIQVRASEASLTMCRL